ncbi:putative Type IV secretory pathway, protease TraF [Burkholderiales bacterium GJ-E10]|nr:putative Type IV secretory pathway, protease TraF [Burkholderiales bacterium GJ-E10]
MQAAASILAAAALSMTAAGLAHQAGYRLNLTSSAPIGVYRISPAQAAAPRGALVVVCPPVGPQRFRFLHAGGCPSGAMPFLKTVAAVAGDRVQVSDAGVRVNGRMLPDSAPIVRSDLPRLREAVRLPPGQIWLWGRGSSEEGARRSFDSRYFGPVSTASVRGVARAVWCAGEGR